MATPNVGILTNAGKNLIDRVNAGQTKITFSKIVFSSMNNNQLTDDQIKALTTVVPQEVVINNPEVTLDNNTGETRIRATGNNRALSDGVYVKTYAVYAKDGSSNEILYGITVSPNPNYLPEYDGVTPQAVTYSYKVNISNTSNITFGNSDDIYVSDTDLAEALKPYAKTVYVNQQMDKKVNVSDMRKPASDVAGIDEVSTKQDKIGYTPADDSKVVHNSGNEGIGGQKTFDIAPIDKKTGNPYITKSDAPKVDLSSYATNSQLATKADDSKVVHKTGYEEITGQKTFDIAPIDNTTGNPYITKNGVPSIPSDVARTGQSQTFTAAQTFSSAPTILDTSSSKGDNQAAVMADLKSVEKSAWHIMSGSSEALKTYNCWYKINKDKKRLEIIVLGVTNEMPSYNTNTVLDLSSIITSISRCSGRFNTFEGDAYGNDRGSLIFAEGARVKTTTENISTTSNLPAQIISDGVETSNGTGNPAYVYYDDLQDAYK